MKKAYAFGIIAALIIIISAPSVAVAEDVIGMEYQYIEYTVQKGDTLWDIAMANLEDPYQWPMLWKENLRLNNPDRIYPGQVIKIPVAVKQLRPVKPEPLVEYIAAPEPVKPEPEAPAPVAAVETPVAPPPPAMPEKAAVEVNNIAAISKVSAIDKRMIFAAGYISKEPPTIGRISKADRQGTIFGAGDGLYVSLNIGVNKGDRFFIVREGDKIDHPETKKYLGRKYTILGFGEVASIDEDGVLVEVIESFSEMHIGDYIDRYYEFDLLFPADTPRTPDVKALVVSTTFSKDLSGLFDILHLDKGREDGLQAGDVLETLVPETHNKRNAIVRIINVRETTSTAVILRARQETQLGDRVVGLQKD